MIDLDDTIAALSTTPGTSGVAVIKISGPKAYQCAQKLFRPRNSIDNWPPRKMVLGDLIDESGEVVDEALACFMPAPASYTRQDVVEIQTHGGRAASSTLLDMLADLDVRMAQPGEFTRRAFLLGRIDLAQAEAILDIISAKTRASLVAAKRQLSGALSGKINELRDKLMQGKALLEVNIEFPEEEIGELDRAGLLVVLEEVKTSLNKLMDTYKSGRLFREGANCVIAGRPNVGKSSLLNRLLDKRRAIVTDTPGTTRDAIEATANIDGVPFRLVDTAGLRESMDPIEGEGVKITKEQIESADLVLLMIDAAEGITEQDDEIIKEICGDKVLYLANKIDLLDSVKVREILSELPQDALAISAKTGENISTLRSAMIDSVRGGPPIPSDEAILTNARHRQSIKAGFSVLKVAIDGLNEGRSPELIAYDVEESSAALGEILGDTTPDEVLDLIFSQFCIGK